MRNFIRAVPLALKYRWSLLGVVLTSLLLGLLWGLNIGAVYPFVEVVFRGDSMQKWIDERIEESSHRSAELRATIARLEGESPAASSEQRRQWEQEIADQQSRLLTEEKSLATARWAQGPIHRYLPKTPFQTLITIVVLVLLGTILKDLAVIANVLFVTRVAEKTARDLRAQLYERILSLEIGAFSKDRTGELMSRFTGDLSGFVNGVTILFGRSLREPLKMIACLGGAAWISWRLLCLSLLIMPLAFLLSWRLTKSIKQANRWAMEEMGAFYHRLAESFMSMELVKAFTAEHFERDRFQQKTEVLYRKALRVNLLTCLPKLNTELFGIAVICLALLGGGYLVLHRETHLLGIRVTERPLSFGTLMLFYALLIGASDPGRKMAGVFSDLQWAAAAADRVYQLLDRQPTISDPARPRALGDEPRDLIFDHVSFHYESGQPVLQDIHLQIPRGECLAIIGPNGCGKSTLANLIPRFYDPSQGAVRLGSVDVRDVRLHDLRKRIGMVTQQTMLLDDTVMNNIRYGAPDATDRDVVEAAHRAQAHRFITEDLSQGYETNIGERGNRLSGGQRQRIALARAMLRDPAILILDECTSQIDLESERLIHDVMQSFAQGRTTIMITHRLASLAIADRILVLDGGRMAGVGTHEELFAQCAPYRSLCNVGLRKAA